MNANLFEEFHEKAIRIDSSGIALDASFFVPGKQSEEKMVYPALIFCHGMPARPYEENNELIQKDNDPSYRDLAIQATKLGLAALIFNFRGTGRSEGNYHPKGWANDLEAVLQWVWNHEEVDIDRIAVLGSSMGARVAIYVASRRPEVSVLVSYAAPVHIGTTSAEQRLEEARNLGIIRDTDFPPSVKDWAEELFILDPIDSVQRVSPIPLFIVHGDSDDIVDPDDALLLYQLAKEPKELAILPGVGHRFRSEPIAVKKVLSWLTKQFEL